MTHIRLYILVVFLVAGAGARAQSIPGCDTLHAAYVSWIHGDTLGTMHSLEAFERGYPTGWAAGIVRLKLGEIYWAYQRYAEAKAILTKGLALPFRTDWSQPIATSYYPLFSGGEYVWTKTEMCVWLAKLAKRDGQPALALEYLNKADRVYKPDGFEDNTSAYLYHARLAPLMADCYLDMGDTASAIQVLGAHVLWSEKAARELYFVLRIKYTPGQIKEELDRCMAHPSRVAGQTYDTLIYCFFGTEINREYINDPSRAESHLWYTYKLAIFGTQ